MRSYRPYFPRVGGRRRLSTLIDLTGKKFGKLTVIKHKGSNRSSSLWICKCECGTTPILNGAHLRNGSCNSCGCGLKKHQTRICDINARKRFNPENWIKTVMNFSIDAARKRGLVFSLTEKEFREFIVLDCFYCGVGPSNLYNNRSKLFPKIHKYSGIDRVDNGVGYIKGNCVPCCRDCNYAKSNRTKEEFLNWAIRVAERSNVTLSTNP